LRDVVHGTVSLNGRIEIGDSHHFSYYNGLLVLNAVEEGRVLWRKVCWHFIFDQVLVWHFYCHYFESLSWCKLYVYFLNYWFVETIELLNIGVKFFAPLTDELSVELAVDRV